MDGNELLKATREKYPSIPFVMMTAHASVERAVAAMRDGATDYLQKPFEAASLVNTVKRMAKRSGLDSSEMIAEDSKTKRILEIVKRVAPSDASIMISGESGTGKEVLAKTIHECSNRKDKPFVALTVRQFLKTCLRQFSLGMRRAHLQARLLGERGKFEQANGGTLLLDEISEMALELQAKLLRVLQEQEVERLGGKAAIPLDVRVLATTNRHLTTEVAEGRFRKIFTSD